MVSRPAGPVVKATPTRISSTTENPRMICLMVVPRYLPHRYFIEGEEEPLPQPGDYSVILNSKDEAVCIIQTTKTTVVPFDKVSAEHAYKEGEGDRSLAYWRMSHEEFFAEEYKETQIEFNGQTRILCEEFKVVYKAIDVN